MSIDIEEAVRAEFAGRAAQASTASRSPYPKLERRIIRRRRTTMALTATAVVAALGVGTGVALGTSDGRRAAPAAPAATGKVVGGCGTTPLRYGNAPAWTAFARAPEALPYVVSAHGNAVGFVWADPLHSGAPKGTANKILWVVRDNSMTAGPLTINARAPQGSSAKSVSHREPPIGVGLYPSTVDLPVPGCWHFTLTWSTGTATVDLPYT
jgi:hypothetical protein